VPRDRAYTGRRLRPHTSGKYDTQEWWQLRQANRELRRGCPVERILSWRERGNHSRRAEIKTTHESHSSEAAWRAGGAGAC
jgi:hypothetical protein